jgi:hypothetical protein
MRKEINYMRMAVMNTAGAEQQVCISILKKLERARKLNKIRIAILKAITWIASFLFIISVCALDSEDITIPVMVMLASGLWLTLIIFANEKLR